MSFEISSSIWSCVNCMKFGWNLLKTGDGVVFQKPYNRKFSKVHRMTPNQTQATQREKYPTYVHCSTLSPILSARLALWSAVFEIFHILVFPIDSHVKISKWHKFFKLIRLPRQVIAVFHYGSQCPHKVWVTSHENCRRSSVLKFPAPHSSMLTKFQSAVTFYFWQIAQKVIIVCIAPWLTHFYNLWLKSDGNCRRSSVLKFCLP